MKEVIGRSGLPPDGKKTALPKDEVQLSPHFQLSEFEIPDPAPAETIACFRGLCNDLLEPIRDKFNLPIIITSGYRSPEHNQAVGGAKTSQHVATAQHCAADFKMDCDLQVVFDWIRLSSGLKFDQVILERAEHGGSPANIHISYCHEEPRRAALEGLTHGRSSYISRVVGPEKALYANSDPAAWGQA